MLILQLNPLDQSVALAEIVLLLAGSAFVGWLLARWVMAGRVNGLRETIIGRQSELDECQARRASAAPSGVRAYSKNSVGSENGLDAASQDPDPEPAPLQSVADDLKRIEGIGPKIEGLLNADGIRTFARLAATDPQHLASLLSAAGPRFQIHDPGTWPQQAALARDGKWEELRLLQEKLVHGKE